MNKLDLIEVLKNEAGMGKKESAAAVKTLFDKMSETLASGDRVEIHWAIMCRKDIGRYLFFVFIILIAGGNMNAFATEAIIIDHTCTKLAKVNV